MIVLTILTKLNERGLSDRDRKEQKLIKDEKLYKMSKISRTQIELNVLETFTTIQDIPIPEEICIEWLLPDMKIEEARTFLQRLKEKGALQFEEKQAEYTIQSAWLQPVCCQDRVKENYNRLVELNGDSLEKQDLLKSKKYIKFTESVLENIKPVKETQGKNIEEEIKRIEIKPMV